MKSWPENEYIYRKGNDVLDERGKTFDFTNSELFSDWEKVKEPEPDWQYIIDHKCLCLFWDDDADIYTLGILTKISDVADQLGDFKYKWNINGKYWKNCRPVRKDEVTFYEDTESTHPSIGSLYKGGIYIGEYNGKEVVMMLNDEKEEMIWVDAMNLEHRRPLSILEWQLYKENKEVIDEALEKYGEPLQGDEWCWSSSEYGSNGAWGFRPSDGAMYFGNANKNFSNRVRCVLAF